MAAVNHLECGDLIEVRIREQITDFADVLPISSLLQLQEKSIREPSCFVMYAGDDVREVGLDGKLVKLRQRWLVIVATHHAQGKDKTRNPAGEMMHLVLQTLLGWQPSTSFTRLKAATPPKPGYGKAFGYYPLAFETEVNVLGTTQTC